MNGESSERLARAIRGLTIALWASIAIQVISYGLSWVSYFRATRTDTSASSPSSPVQIRERGPDEDYDPDFNARPLKDKIRLASAILILGREEVNGIHRSIVKEVVKLKPGVRLYYKAGDEYEGFSHFASETCEGCDGEGAIVFMQGNPAQMSFSFTYEKDRLASLGGITIDEFRQRVREAESAPAAQ